MCRVFLSLIIIVLDVLTRHDDTMLEPDDDDQVIIIPTHDDLALWCRNQHFTHF